MDDINGYKLSRQWYDFSFENPDKVKPIHSAIYFFAIEHCNRLGWKEKFGFPSQMAMEAIGVKNWRTYIKAFNDLVDWGFFKLVEKSKNQYSSNIIAIVKNTKANTKALDKALQKHSQKQVNSTVSIDKQLNKEQKNNKPSVYEFDDFWDDYGNKRERSKCETKWNSISEKQKRLIKEFLPIYKNHVDNVDYLNLKYPYTFLNSEIWKDEWDEYKEPESKQGMNQFLI